MELPGEKLLIKLWETLAERGIGSLLMPWNLKREGRARNELRREELLMLAQAESDVADIRAGRKHLAIDGSLRLLAGTAASVEGGMRPPIEVALNLPSLTSRSNAQGIADAARREINTSKALIFAEDVLANDPQLPPDRAVDDDWLFAWREYAGRVSTEDLQRLWGGVLAGEVKSPGAFSIRTLDFLRALSKSEAERMTRLARFAIEGRISRIHKEHLEKHGVSFGELLHMQELGVISGVEAVGLTTQYRSLNTEKFVKALRSHGKALIVENDDPTKILKLDAYLLTAIGQQVLGLGSFDPDLEYLRLVGKQIIGQGFSVKLADWKEISESEGQYFNAENLDA